MKGRRWLTPALLAGCFIALGISASAQDEKDKEKKAPKLTWEAFKGDKSFFQKMETKTNQEMTVNSMTVTQDQNQTFYFEWTPKGKDDAGNYKVEQKILAVKMDIDIGGNKISVDTTKAEDDNPRNEFFKALAGSTFTLYLNLDKNEVVKVDGVKKLVEDLTRVNQSMKPLLQQILGEEAVKNMAESMIGILPEGEKTEWENTRTLKMGPIGSYETTSKYKIADPTADPVKIDVKTTLKYVPPKSDERGGLPFEITEANLSGEGDGTITFSKSKGRIEKSDMNVKLNGDIKVKIAGSTTQVDLKQTQTTTVEAYDQNPLKK